MRVCKGKDRGSRKGEERLAIENSVVKETMQEKGVEEAEEVG